MDGALSEHQADSEDMRQETKKRGRGGQVTGINQWPAQQGRGQVKRLCPKQLKVTKTMKGSGSWARTSPLGQDIPPGPGHPPWHLTKVSGKFEKDYNGF